MIFGGFVKVEPIKNVQLGINVYNLLNTFALQGPAGFVGGSNNTLINAQPARGRSVKGSVRVSF